MRARLAVSALAASLIAFPATAAQDVSAESVLSGTRWMEVTQSEAEGTIAVERLYRVRLCTIADVAFVIREGLLMRFDRSVLSGKTQPVGYARSETSQENDGGTLIALYVAMDSAAPERLRIDTNGDVMRIEGGDAGATAYFMKCRPQN